MELSRDSYGAGKALVRVGASAATDAAGATVDEDELDDEAVLVAEQQNQHKERTQSVSFTLFTRERSRDMSDDDM